MYKIINILLICFCATFAAETFAAEDDGAFPSTIGVFEEVEQLQQELSEIKAEAYQKITADPNYSVDMKNRAIERLDRIQVSSEKIQKLADEPGISDHQKHKVLKKMSRLAKRSKRIQGRIQERIQDSR